MNIYFPLGSIKPQTIISSLYSRLIVRCSFHIYTKPQLYTFVQFVISFLYVESKILNFLYMCFRCCIFKLILIIFFFFYKKLFNWNKLIYKFMFIQIEKIKLIYNQLKINKFIDRNCFGENFNYI